MVYLTGDIHGDVFRVIDLVESIPITKDDILVLLGDVGINYNENQIDDRLKKDFLNRLNVPIFCIHGNHEMRPESISSYIESDWHGGKVYIESKYPNLIFAKDGEIYDLEGNKAIVIGGAYSVDKYYRLRNGLQWFEDEQPSDETKKRIMEELDSIDWNIDFVLTHTCPTKYIPTEAFLPGLDQSSVDRSTEDWLDEIENNLTYQKWYCGHWHIDKHIDKLSFLMHSVECL